MLRGDAPLGAEYCLYASSGITWAVTHYEASTVDGRALRCPNFGEAGRHHGNRDVGF